MCSQFVFTFRKTKVEGLSQKEKKKKNLYPRHEHVEITLLRHQPSHNGNKAIKYMQKTRRQGLYESVIQSIGKADPSKSHGYKAWQPILCHCNLILTLKTTECFCMSCFLMMLLLSACYRGTSWKMEVTTKHIVRKAIIRSSNHFTMAIWAVFQQYNFQSGQVYIFLCS